MTTNINTKNITMSMNISTSTATDTMAAAAVIRTAKKSMKADFLKSRKA